MALELLERGRVLSSEMRRVCGIEGEVQEIFWYMLAY
jgi:hypothetical protein